MGRAIRAVAIALVVFAGAAACLGWFVLGEQWRGYAELILVENGFDDRVTIRGLEFRDETGRIAVEAESIALDLDVHALVYEERVALADVELTRPNVRLALPLGGSAAPSPGKEPARRISFRIDRLSITGGTLRIQDAKGRAFSFDGVRGGGDVAIAGSDVNATIRDAAARWVDEARSITATGWLALGPSRVTAAATIGTDEGTGSIALTHPGAGAPWIASANATVRGAKLELNGNAAEDLSAIRAQLGFADLDPRAFVAALPEGRIAGSGTVELVRDPRWNANAALVASGTLGTDRLDHAELAAQVAWNEAIGVRDLEAQATVELRGSLGDARGSASVTSDRDGRVSMESARILGKIAAFERWLPKLKIAGPADVDLSASGPIDDFSLDGEIAMLKSVRIGGIVARRARATLHFRGLPDRPAGKIKWSATDLVIPGGGISLRNARGEIELVRTPKGERLVFRKIRLDTAAGTITASGEADARKPAQSFRVHVRVANFDLGRLQRELAPDLRARRPLEGKLTAQADLAREGRWLQADARGSVAGFRWSKQDLPPLDLRELRASLAKGTVSLDATVVRSERESIALSLAARAPGDPTQPRAWLRLGDGDVTRARAELRGVDLAWVAQVLALPPEVTGHASGTIELVDDPRRLAFELSGEELAFLPIRVDHLGASLRGSLAAHTITIDRVVASRGGRVLVQGDARLDRGLADLAGRGERGIDGAPVRGTLELLDIAVEELGLVDANLVSGRLGGTLAIDGAIALDAPLALLGGELHVTLRAPRIAGVDLNRIAINGALRGRTNGARRGHTFEGEVYVVRSQGGRIEIDGLFDNTDWSFKGVVRAISLDLSVLRRFAKGPDNPLAEISGRLEARADIDGSLSAPAGTLAATITKGRVLLEDGWQKIDRADLRARMKDGTATIEKLTARSGRGLFQADGTFTFDQLTPIGVALELSANRVAIPIRGVPAEVVLHGTLTGSRVEETFAMTAKVRDGIVKLPEGLGGKLQSLKRLEDVVFVDQREPSLAAQVVGDTTAEWLRFLPLRRAKIFELAIDLSRGVRVKNTDLDVLIIDDPRDPLRLTLAGKLLSLTGTIMAKRDSGTVNLFGRRYGITRATAQLDGRTPLNVQIEIQVAHEFRTATVYVDINGTTDKWTPELWSDPPIYDDAQILGFILGGEPDDEAGAGDLPVEARAAGLASQLVADQLRLIVAELIPLDVLRLKPGEDGAIAGGGFDTGWWFTERLFAGYRYRPTVDQRQNTHELQVQYEFVRKWIVDARGGDRGVISADVLRVFRW